MGKSIRMPAKFAHGCFIPLQSALFSGLSLWMSNLVYPTLVKLRQRTRLNKMSVNQEHAIKQPFKSQTGRFPSNIPKHIHASFLAGFHPTHAPQPSPKEQHPLVSTSCRPPSVTKLKGICSPVHIRAKRDTHRDLQQRKEGFI